MSVTFANSFAGTGFGWRQGGAGIERLGGLVDRWSGEATFETKADFDTVFALLRPVNVRVIANVRAFVDYWAGAASPLHTLVLNTADAAGTVTTETRVAILSDCKRARLLPDGSAVATLEFTAADL